MKFTQFILFSLIVSSAYTKSVSLVKNDMITCDHKSKDSSLFETNSLINQTKSYNATSCTHGGMTSGNWANSNLYYAGSSAASQGSIARQSPETSPIVINEIYFEADSNKIKFTNGKLPDCTQ